MKRKFPAERFEPKREERREAKLSPLARRKVEQREAAKAKRGSR